MSISLQKASFWKRISAYLFDLILAVMLTVGLATLLSVILGYNSHIQKMENFYTQYEQAYGIDLNISEENYNKLTPEEQAVYQTANEAFGKDEQVRQTYDTMFNLTLVIISGSLLFSHLILYFGIPLFFRNGQTLGKKIFGLGVMRSNCVQITNPVLFIRTILGQYAIETMVPVLLLIMLYFNTIGIVGILVLLLIGILQIGVLMFTQTNSSIHDLLADTVVIDFASQQIFQTEEDLLAYKQELHEQEVANSQY